MKESVSTDIDSLPETLAVKTTLHSENNDQPGFNDPVQAENLDVVAPQIEAVLSSDTKPSLASPLP